MSKTVDLGSFAKQVQTERGMISADSLVFTPEQAERNGYSYSFYSSKLDLDVYGKALDPSGHYHSFVILLDKEVNDKVAEQLKGIPVLNDGIYKYYNVLADNGFILEDKDIGTYNHLVDTLNVNCLWLLDYQRDKDAFKLCEDPVYQKHLEKHSITYDLYFTMQENALAQKYNIDNDEHDEH